jgi:glycosyltransferase involved in cell wall biosynthesis
MRKIIYISSSSDNSGVPNHILHLVEGLKERYRITVIGDEGWLKNEINNYKVIKPKLFNLFKLRNFIKSIQDRDTIVHFEGVRAGIIGTLALWDQDNIVFTEHNWTKDYQLDQSWREPIQQKLLEIIIRKSQKTICVSKSVKDFLQNLIYPNGDYQVIYNGVEFTDRDDYKKDNKFIIGTIGSLVKRKRIDWLIECLPHLGDKYQLKILGNGEQKPYLDSLMGKYNLKNRVDYVRDKENLFKQIDLYVQPSRDESFGMGLAEAVGSGIPSIGAYVGAIPELLDVKYLFSDKSEMTKKILEIRSNYQKYLTEFQSNKKEFQLRFSKERMIRQHYKLYKGLDF